ncbi:hypothetical protein B566_EDAN012435 [Ephemera danica]|nr:hypothetical protein B566_EDAN012435 [Ephemera danica]
MTNLRTITLFLVLSTFHNLILAGTPSTNTSPNQCSTYCTDSKLLRLRPGTSYEYSYSGWTETLLAPHSSRPEDHDLASGLLLNATVTVTALSPCEIQLDDAEFKDAEPQLDTQKAEEAMALTLALLDEIAPYRQALEVQRDTAGKFGRLVRLMRQLPHQYLYNLATLNPQSDTARELVMDALPVLDTSAATTTMATLYAAREEQVPRLRHWLEHRAAPWFASLAYSRRPTSEMLKGALVLLREYEEGRLPHSDGTGIVLGLTGLAHALCEKLGGTSKCSENRVIHATVAALERIAAGDDERARIVAIKGLSNIGVFHNGEKLLQKYYQLRLAAMDAFRRAPCPNPMAPSPLLNVYMDTTQDSEARIAAYLAAVRCPTAALMRAVKRTLYSETVNQVGSFVWTHLTNSQESRSKSRQPLRALIANEFLQNKFRTDARQFSRNFEVSRYFESLGIGATADSNVIFSTKSYLPRSAMLNLTIDLFGESVNLLEIGGRAEGLEPFVERLFSREGLLSNEPLAEMLRNSRSDPTLDAARNLTSPLKQIVTPTASTYIRLFGNEISYKELEDILETSQKFDVNPSIILKALINRNEHKFSRSFELVDVTQEVPTAIGLPLKLSVNGSASVHMAMTGNMESKKTGVQVSGKFAPSANIAMTGTMAVGNDDFKQGIKFEAMMYTHTTLESRLKISFDGKFNFQSEMPNEKQTLIEITSERFIFNGDKVSRLPDLTPDRETYVECTGEFADKLFGVKICSEVSYPNASLVETSPYFPLSGDSHINITIVKTDPTFKTYDFSTSWSYVPGKKYDFGISYDRLGSSMENRRRVVQAVFDRNAGVARVTLDLPEKQAEIAVNWDSKELSAADLVVTYDRVTIADVFAKMTHQPKVLPGATIATAGKYEPELKFKVKGLPEFTIAGVVNYVANQKVSTELRLVGLTERTLTLAADYARDAPSGAVDARISVDTPWIAWDVKGSAKLTSNSLGLRVGGVYNVSVDEQHNIDLLAKYNWNVQGALRRDYLNLRAQMSEVSLSGGGGSAYVTELSREPVRASLQAGRVETLCVSETTAPLQRWALNVKRGVLSALQLSLRSTPDVSGTFTVHESDVSGTCRTQYEYLQMDEATLVTRKKDLALCSGRSGYGDVTRPLTLDPSATLSSRPLLRGDQECLQTIREGHVTLVRCRESHVFQPFSNGDNGAHTHVEQVLVLERVMSQWPRLSGQVMGEVMTSRGYYEASVRATLADETWNVTQRAQSSGGGDVWLSTKVQCPQRDVDFQAEHRHKKLHAEEVEQKK